MQTYIPAHLHGTLHHVTRHQSDAWQTSFALQILRALVGAVTDAFFFLAALHPEEGNYRRKGGLEQQHICDPDADFLTAEAAASAAANANFSSSPHQQILAQLAVQQPATLEMNLFSARENFDDLMTGVRKPP